MSEDEYMLAQEQKRQSNQEWERAMEELTVYNYTGDDEWGVCVHCGTETNDADIWQPHCPRCAELAELEREIGRAVIGFNIVHTTMQDGQDPLLLTAYGSLNTEESALIARWRKLHAEGAEAAQGGEEA